MSRSTRVDEYADATLAHYQAALSTMSSEFERAVVDGELSYDASSVEFSIQNGDEDLSRADAVAGEAQQSTIEHLRETGNLSEALNQAYDSLVQALSAQRRGDQYLNSSRFDDAVERYKEGKAAAGEAISSFETASEVAVRLREISFESDQVEFERIRSLIQNSRSYTVGFRALCTGDVDYARGTEHLELGEQNYNNEAYNAAAADYAVAEQRFSTAASAYRDGEDVEVYSIADRLIELACRADLFAEASGHFEQGSEAVADGDSATAREEFNNGREATNETQYC